MMSPAFAKGQPRAHHFISQCYLRGFTSDGSKKSKLCVASLAEQKTFESKPEGVAHRRDFNRVDGLAPGVIEFGLSIFEGEAATALDRIGAERTLEDSQAWGVVLQLVALFAVRHPLQRARHTEMAENVSRAVLEQITSTPEQWDMYVGNARATGRIPADTDVPYEVVRNIVKQEEFSIEVPTGKHLDLEFAIHGPVFETLRSRRWTLFIADNDAGNFVSSDCPVALVLPDGAAGPLEGHRERGTAVIFPINRKLLAMGVFDGPAGIRNLKASDVALFNYFTFCHSDREVYGSNWESLS